MLPTKMQMRIWLSLTTPEAIIFKKRRSSKTFPPFILQFFCKSIKIWFIYTRRSYQVSTKIYRTHYMCIHEEQWRESTFRKMYMMLIQAYSHTKCVYLSTHYPICELYHENFVIWNTTINGYTTKDEYEPIKINKPLSLIEFFYERSTKSLE